jgi:sensitive to high expression protein 9
VTSAAASAPASAVIPGAATIPATTAIEAEIDKVVEPIGPPLDETATEMASQEGSATPEAVTSTSEAADLLQKETVHSDATIPTSEAPATATPDAIAELAATDIEAELDHDRTRLEKITAKLEELVSDEQISVRKKDLTAAVCASAAAGWVCAIVAFWIGNRS